MHLISHHEIVHIPSLDKAYIFSATCHRYKTLIWHFIYGDPEPYDPSNGKTVIFVNCSGLTLEDSLTAARWELTACVLRQTMESVAHKKTPIAPLFPLPHHFTH